MTTGTDRSFFMTRTEAKCVGDRRLLAEQVGPLGPDGDPGRGELADEVHAGELTESGVFIDTAQPRSGDLPPVLDLEVRNGPT